ncbi:hypothetical protein CCS92_32290, partial [Methylobacterium radiotolerans]
MRDDAGVRFSNAPRLGIFGHADQDAFVLGIVRLRRGSPSLPTIQRVEAEIEKINASGILPPDVRIVPLYDRSGLIGKTTHTVMHNLVFGVALVSAGPWLFLGSPGRALIVAGTKGWASVWGGKRGETRVLHRGGVGVAR